MTRMNQHFNHYRSWGVAPRKAQSDWLPPPRITIARCLSYAAIVAGIVFLVWHVVTQ